jgi:hypothetical protein
MRIGILFGFLAGALGYLTLSRASNLPTACAAIVLAHAGGSAIWIFSSTLLQLGTDDRFRGRVFSAEFAFSVITMSFSSYSAGLLIDHSVPVSVVAVGVGVAMMIPAIVWAFALATALRD